MFILSTDQKPEDWVAISENSMKGYTEFIKDNICPGSYILPKIVRIYHLINNFKFIVSLTKWEFQH